MLQGLLLRRRQRFLLLLFDAARLNLEAGAGGIDLLLRLLRLMLLEVLLEAVQNVLCRRGRRRVDGGLGGRDGLRGMLLDVLQQLLLLLLLLWRLLLMGNVLLVLI